VHTHFSEWWKGEFAAREGFSTAYAPDDYVYQRFVDFLRSIVSHPLGYAWHITCRDNIVKQDKENSMRWNCLVRLRTSNDQRQDGQADPERTTEMWNET
jgi:hypothetical protein